MRKKNPSPVLAGEYRIDDWMGTLNSLHTNSHGISLDKHVSLS